MYSKPTVLQTIGSSSLRSNRYMYRYVYRVTDDWVFLSSLHHCLGHDVNNNRDCYSYAVLYAGTQSAPGAPVHWHVFDPMNSLARSPIRTLHTVTPSITPHRSLYRYTHRYTIVPTAVPTAVTLALTVRRR